MRRAILAGLILCSASNAALAQTFHNYTRIGIVDNAPATVYPSTIGVSGVNVPIRSIRVSLHGVSHSYLSDVQVVLVAPNGQAIGLVGCVAPGAYPRGADWTFTVDASQTLTNSTIGTGDYAISWGCGGISLPAPAPAGPYSTNLASLNGSTANGNWNLYVADMANLDFGEIGAGWSLTINPDTQFTYQGKLNLAGQPFTDPAIVRFWLFDKPTGGPAISPMVETNPTPDSDGHFSVPVDFGLNALGSGEPRWLEVSVMGLLMQPRRELSVAPRAATAFRAQQADWAKMASWVPASGVGGTTASGLSIRSGVTMGIDEGNNAHVELNNMNAGTPYIDFSRNVGTDFNGRIILNDSSTLQIQATNVRILGNFINNSDARDKHDIRPIGDALSLVSSLKGVRYFWNDHALDGSPLPENEQIGFVAQDVEKVLPELVATDAEGRKGVSYVSVVPLLTEAIKELRAQNQELRRRLDELERLNTPSAGTVPK